MEKTSLAKSATLILIFLFMFVFSPDSTNACTVCSSEPGQLLRLGILNEDFASNLLMTAAPFPLVLALATLLFRLLPDSKTKPAVNPKLPEKKESYE